MRTLWHEGMGITSDSDACVDESTYYQGMLYLEDVETHWMGFKHGQDVHCNVPFQYRWKGLTIEGTFPLIFEGHHVHYMCPLSITAARDRAAMDRLAAVLALGYEATFGVLPHKLILESFERRAPVLRPYTFWDTTPHALALKVEAFLLAFIDQRARGIYRPPAHTRTCRQCIRLAYCPLATH